MRALIHSAAVRAGLVTAISILLVPALTEEAAFQERSAASTDATGLAEQLASVAATFEATELKEAALPAPAFPASSAKTLSTVPVPRSMASSTLAEKGGRVIAASGETRRRPIGAPQSILRAGLAVGDAEMRTALAGPQSAESRVLRAMSFRSRKPDFQPAQAEEGKSDRPVSSRFAALAPNAPPVAGAAGEKEDELLTLAYAPAPGPRSKSAVFDHVLKREQGFIPPLGPKDHSWAATPLPVAAYSKKEQSCLATAIYFEARGEDEKGQAAVAQVILNRVRNPAYPNTICGVVYQNQSWKNRCQFSFACDGIEDRVIERRAYAVAERIAHKVTAGETWIQAVGSATNYHATYVKPRWAKAMERVDKIGRHIFYRTFAGGWD